MPKELWDNLLFTRTILGNKYIPHKPTEKQEQFIRLGCREALFGGSAGGGKSDALLMLALQYAEVPGYSAIILRRTFADLSLPKALLDRAHEWLGGSDAKWDGTRHCWAFPSGAKMAFGYLETEVDKYRYQSSDYQTICFDELTQFTESQYRYVLSRLRRLENSPVPLRVRSATNPGGLGHEWVKQRFITEQTSDRAFIPAKLADNPFLDRQSYRQQLMLLDPVTRQQLLDGDWDVKQTYMFKRAWFKIVDSFPADAKKARFWDKAATEPKRGKEPDWTAGVLMAEKNGAYYIIDVKRFRGTPQYNEAQIRQTAELDGVDVAVVMEQEPGSSGVNDVDHYAREVLQGFNFSGERSTGSKVTRAAPLASASEAGNVKLVRGAWITAFLDEAENFPSGLHDDQVDAASGAIQRLTKPKTQSPAWLFG